MPESFRALLHKMLASAARVRTTKAGARWLRPRSSSVRLRKVFGSGRPEPAERFAVRRLAELFEGALANLADSLAGDTHQGADLLERHRLGAFLEPVVEVEDLPFARREILLEYAIDELAHQLVVGYLFDLGAVDAGEAFAQGGSFAIGSINGSVEADFGRRHLLRGTYVRGRLFEQAADFVFGGIALEDLGEDRLGAGETDELRVLVERDSDGAGLFGQGFEDGLANPPDGVGDELDALVRIELSNRFEEALVADRDELAQIETVALVFLDVGDDESEVRGDEPLGGFFIALLGSSGKSTLFLGIVDQRELLDVLQILIKRGRRRRSEIALRRSSLGHLLHTRSFPIYAG